MSKPAPKRAGERVEHLVVEQRPELVNTPESEAVHYDATTVSELTTSAELPIEGAVSVPAETPVEIKSVMAAVTEESRAGRYYFRRRQHEVLSDLGGVYLLAVCEPKPSREIVAWKVLTPAVLDEHLGSWVEPEGRQPYAQLAWTSAIDREAIEGR